MDAASQSWEGTSSELLNALGEIAGEREVKSKRWPGNASALSKYLRRVVPPLRRVGIEISFSAYGSNSYNLHHSIWLVGGDGKVTGDENLPSPMFLDFRLIH